MVIARGLFGVFIWVFLISFVGAEVSHGAGQINMPGGGTLESVLGSFPPGTQICTSALSGDGNCIDSQGKWNDGVAAGDIYYGGGKVGIGTNTPPGNLTISSDGSYQLWITGKTDPNQRLYIGYNTASNYGAIQATLYGGTYQYLSLNPNGGNVGIGTTTPGAKLEVVGDLGVDTIEDRDGSNFFEGCTGGNFATGIGSNGQLTCAAPPAGSGDITSVVESGTTPLTFSGCTAGDCSIGMQTDGSGVCSSGYACIGGHTHDWSTITNRPLSAYGSGIQAQVYYDDDPNYRVDANSISQLNDVRANIYYDRGDTNYYVNPAGNSRFGGSLRATALTDENDPNYYVDPNSNSRFYNDVTIVNGWMYAPRFVDVNNPSQRYVDPTDHTQIGSLTAYGNIYAFDGLTVNNEAYLRGNSGLWELRLFVWENSGCNYQGSSLGCNNGRCLCIQKTA
ncbi:MAG: hypothetical protein ABH864_04650 [archaeon]